MWPKCGWRDINRSSAFNVLGLISMTRTGKKDSGHYDLKYVFCAKKKLRNLQTREKKRRKSIKIRKICWGQIYPFKKDKSIVYPKSQRFSVLVSSFFSVPDSHGSIRDGWKKSRRFFRVRPSEKEKAGYFTRNTVMSRLRQGKAGLLIIFKI